MEDIENDDFTDSASGVNSDISGWLNDKFAFPGTDDPVKVKQPVSGFDSYLADKFD